MPDPTRPTPAPAPTPWWRRAADAVGLGGPLDVLGSLGDVWSATQSPEGKARQADLERQLAEAQARTTQRQQSAVHAVTDPIRRFFGTTPMRVAGQAVADTARPYTEVPWDVRETGRVLHEGVDRPAQQLWGPQGLQVAPALKPVEWLDRGLRQAIPNFAIDTATDSPAGQALNAVDLPLPAIAEALGPAAHLAGVLPHPGRSIEEAGALLREAMERPGITAYHGSPHLFAPEPGAPFGRFRADKIGSGQGAASYGHGHYLAEAEPVARDYRRELSTPEVTIGGQVQQVPAWFPDLSPQPRLIRHLADMRANRPGATDAEIIDAVRQRLSGDLALAETSTHSDALATQNHLQRQLDILDAAVGRGLTISPGGHMYEARVHVDPSELLDWDAPVSQQSDAVQRVAAGLPFNNRLLADVRERHGGGYPTGADLYHALLKAPDQPYGWQPGSNPAARSAALQEAGIPGLRYLDQGSRQPRTQWVVRGTLPDGTTRERVFDHYHVAQDHLQTLLASGSPDAVVTPRLTPQTRNLVMFPGSESLIDIRRRYGLLAPLAAGATASALASQDDDGTGASPAAGLAGIAPILLGGERPVGELARTLKYLGENRYALRAPAIRRLLQAYETGRTLPRKATWGGAEHPELLEAFGGDFDLGKQWARFFGSTSPGTGVPKNTQESTAALAYALHHPGEPFVPDRYYTSASGTRVPELSLYDTVITNAGSKIPSMNLALEGLDPSGPKTEAMGQFMYGLPRSPIDRHVLWSLGSADDTLAAQHKALKAYMADMEGTAKGLNERTVYQRYEDALSRALQSLAPRRNYNALFGDFWEGARALKGEGYQGGPIDILRAQGLLGPGYLADPDRLEHALRRTGSGLWIAR